jgi:hypothetical protein
MWTEDRTPSLWAPRPHATARPARRAAGFFVRDVAALARRPGWSFWAQARNQEVSKRLTEAYAVWRKHLTEAFEAARAAGVITAAAEDAAAVALAAHDGYAVQVAIGAPGAKAMTPADLAESLLQPLETAVTERRTATL